MTVNKMPARAKAKKAASKKPRTTRKASTAKVSKAKPPENTQQRANPNHEPAQNNWSASFWRASAILLFTLIGTFLILFIGAISILDIVFQVFEAGSAQFKNMRAALSYWLRDCIDFIIGRTDKMPFPFTSFPQN